MQPVIKNSQWTNKWLTVSQLHLHIQHHPTKEKPLLIRLSQVRIFPQVIVQTKKDTLLGALVHQTLFLGKELAGAPQIASCKEWTEKMPLFFSFHSILSLPSNKQMSGWYGLV